ncbi:MAG TPA: hypothetical protein VIN66_01320 [Rheinheimera sp.]|uniref:hypothetical protein n=1 Tax=Rheinheimera sp. TaxID=1869214 RepID=UPI002F944293
MITSAIEAYDFEHKAHRKGKGNSQLETYGLLWGYMIPAKDDKSEDKIIVTTCTVETSALRHNDWVEPNYESIQAKKDLICQWVKTALQPNYSAREAQIYRAAQRRPLAGAVTTN